MADDSQLQTLARWHMWPPHRLIWSLFISAALTLVFAIILLRGTAEDPRKNFDESHKALLALAPAPVPDAENAAREYAKAFKAFVRYSGNSADDPAINLGRESEYFETPTVAAYLSANAAAFTILEAATDMPRCNWNLDYSQGLEMPVDHYSPARQAARMLGVRAVVRAHSGDHAGAAQDLKRINTLAAHLSGDRTLLTTLVILSIRAIADAVLQQIVIHETPTKPGDIAAYRDAMEPVENPRQLFYRTYQGEMVFEAELLDRLAMKNFDPPLNAGLGLPDGAVAATTLFYGSERKTLNALVAEFSKYSSEDKPFPDETNWIEQNAKGPTLILHMLMPTISRGQRQVSRSADARLCSDAALALLQFRAKHAHDPKSLDELVPEFLAAVPVDSFTHKPLAILVEGSEIEMARGSNSPARNLPPGTIRVYSFGQNGADDRGKCNWCGEKLENPYSVPARDDTVFFIPPAKK